MKKTCKLFKHELFDKRTGKKIFTFNSLHPASRKEVKKTYWEYCKAVGEKRVVSKHWELVRSQKEM